VGGKVSFDTGTTCAPGAAGEVSVEGEAVGQEGGVIEVFEHAPKLRVLALGLVPSMRECCVSENHHLRTFVRK
jgi:hypothetical protein